MGLTDWTVELPADEARLLVDGLTAALDHLALLDALLDDAMRSAPHDDDAAAVVRFLGRAYRDRLRLDRALADMLSDPARATQSDEQPGSGTQVPPDSETKNEERDEEKNQ